MTKLVTPKVADVTDHRLEKITDLHRLESLHGQARLALGIEFPAEYVRRALSLGLFDCDGRVVGGAMLIVDPPFRSLDSIPECASRSLARQLGDLGDYAEINGVWIAPGIKSPMTSLLFWPKLFRCMLESGRSKFLFTFDHSNVPMASIARWFDPQIVYTGPTKKLPGMERETFETIAILDEGKIAQLASQLAPSSRETIGR